MTGPQQPERWRDLPLIGKIAAVTLAVVLLLAATLCFKAGYHGFLWVWHRA